MPGRQTDWRVQQERFARAESAAEEREQRARTRARAAEEKEAERFHKQFRLREAQAETDALEARVRTLSELLVDGVRAFQPLQLAALRQRPDAEPLALGPDEHPVRAPIWIEPRPPSLLGSYAIDGVTSEIDLAKDNAEALHEVFAPYIAAARRTGGRARSGTGSRGRSSSSSGAVSNAAGRSREGLKAIRDRAKSSGWAVSDRGRLPGNVVEAYNAAHK